MLERYGQRKLSAAELIAADNHLAVCESCRRRAADPQWADASVDFIRQDLTTLAKMETSHLSYEQLAAYVDGDLDQADREIVDSHVELCRTCQDELRELQKFRPCLSDAVIANRQTWFVSEDFSAVADAGYKAESSEPFRSGATSPNSRYRLGSELGTRQNADAHRTDQGHGVWRTLFTPWLRPRYFAGAAAVIAALIVGAVLLSMTFHHSPPGQTSSASSSTTMKAPPQVALATADQVNRDKHIDFPTGLVSRASSSCLDCTDALPAPPVGLDSLIGKTRTLLGKGMEGENFELTSPVGTFVQDVRPLFCWQPLAGASGYEVSVFDSSLNQVSESGLLSAPTWKPKVPLKRGRIYLWQVQATKNGNQIVAPTPPAPEAKFEIIRERYADSVARTRRDYPAAHFWLGRVYAGYGLLDDAEREFQLIPSSDPKYNPAQKFIADLRRMRHRE